MNIFQQLQRLSMFNNYIVKLENDVETLAAQVRKLEVALRECESIRKNNENLLLAEAKKLQLAVGRVEALRLEQESITAFVYALKTTGITIKAEHLPELQAKETEDDN
jgi:hypothetical protein